MTPPNDLAALRAVSARLGADPLLVQGPGGNTSVKAGGVMWIKASGAPLAEAETRDVFVPVDLARLRSFVELDDPLADQPAQFVLRPGGLRPSIETCLHSVFPHRVVIHVHCVRTVAIAICADARERLAAPLAGFAWTFVDYVKPGARLAAEVRAARRPETDVVVLGNHGLMVAADTVASAARLVEAVAESLDAAPLMADPPDFDRLDALAGAGYAPAPPEHPLHGVATLLRLLAVATPGALYPDHVVFCGAGATALAPGDDAGRLAERFAARALAPPPFLLAPGAGALLHEKASSSALAMARCLGDVLARMPEDGAPRYLSDDDVSELLDWDAEKYRRALNAR
jgi:rhamnose utilization protein RhaD (predicted bifunctional aldolase and dehydrogenase)